MTIPIRIRPAREITAEEENFRVEGEGIYGFIRRDAIEAEPVGTIVLRAFRIVGYEPDLDGGLMATLASIDKDENTTGWKVNRIGIDPTTTLVVSAEGLRELFRSPSMGRAEED